MLWHYIQKKKIAKHIIDNAEAAYITYLSGIEKNLEDNKKRYLIYNNNLSIADICFFGEYSQFLFYEIKAMNYLGKKFSSIFEKYKKQFRLSINYYCMLLNNKSFQKIAYNELKKSGVLNKVNFKKETF